MAHITSQLHATATAISTQYDLTPADISTCSLHTSGAMVMLCTDIDSNHMCALLDDGALMRGSDISTPKPFQS